MTEENKKPTAEGCVNSKASTDLSPEATIPENESAIREHRKWVFGLVIATVVSVVFLNIAIFAIYGYENRPRESECREHLLKLGRLIFEYSTGDHQNYPPRKGDVDFETSSKEVLKMSALMKALIEDDKIDRENPDDLDLFLCPFTDSTRGQCDYEGLDYPSRPGISSKSSLLILWDKKSHSKGGRFGLTFKDGQPKVIYYSDKDFQEELRKLKAEKTRLMPGG